MRTLTADCVVAVAKGILDSAGFCFLITQEEGGGASARLIQHVKAEADLTLWFGTSITSRKIRELRSSPRATVACQDPQRPAYVALVGTVAIAEHVEQWRRYWRDDWRTFWPEGPSARDYVLLRFACERVEVQSLAAGIAPPPYGLRAAVVVRCDDGWQLEYGQRAMRSSTPSPEHSCGHRGLAPDGRLLPPTRRIPHTSCDGAMPFGGDRHRRYTSTRQVPSLLGMPTAPFRGQRSEAIDAWFDSDGGILVGGQAMADFARVTIIPTPDTHPGHEQPFLTWINLALIYQLQPATDADHPGARTHLIDVHGRSLYVRETVEEILQSPELK